MMNEKGHVRLGQYHQGDSWLHRCDPRTKLLMLPLLVMVTFSSSGASLVILALFGWGLAGCSGVGSRSLLGGLRPLRWLLLATLLLHLFFTPGRTLWHLSWLSYDGLLLGLRNGCQLLLAMLFASLLSLTTSPEKFTAALASLLAPLRHVGLPVSRMADLLGLTLKFVPLLREEGGTTWREARTDFSALRRGPLLVRGQVIAGLIEPLILRMADHAEELALRMANGEAVLSSVNLPAMNLATRLLVSVACSGLIVWMFL